MAGILLLAKKSLIESQEYYCSMIPENYYWFQTMPQLTDQFKGLERYILTFYHIAIICSADIVLNAKNDSIEETNN